MVCFNGKSLRFVSLLVTLYEKFTYEKPLCMKLDLVALLVTDPPGSSCTIRQKHTISLQPDYIGLSFEPIILFLNYFDFFCLLKKYNNDTITESYHAPFKSTNFN